MNLFCDYLFDSQSSLQILMPVLMLLHGYLSSPVFLIASNQLIAIVMEWMKIWDKA
jgi:hypothetical protein